MSQTANEAQYRPPSFWKKWAVAMLGIYPPLVVLVYLSRIVLDGVPLPIVLFMVSLCLTGLSTGLILPFLHRQFSGWLHR